MIRIEVIRENGLIIYLSLKGHANSDEYGKDLVCAGVSSIITGGLNALKNPKSFFIKINEGDVEVKAKDAVQQDDYKTLEVILTQLKTIEEAEPKRVKIIEKGS